MQRKKPSRFHRIDRDMAKHHLEDDTGHLWAVSYADFLMVLLSFFILFFSVNKEKKDTIINIVAKVKDRGLGTGDGSGGRGVVSATQSGKATAVVNPKGIADAIQSQLKDIKWEVSENEKSVTFMLDDEIFRRGGIRLNSIGKSRLIDLLELLKPFAKDIDIIFVGHTDSRPVITGRIVAVENNFDLSALRAAQAVRVAMDHGLPKGSLFTHGSADNTRSTKSLSIVVVQKGLGRI